MIKNPNCARARGLLMTRTNARMVWETQPDFDGPIAPTLVGYTKAGQPVWAVAGGAAITVTDWIPIEYSSDVVQRVLTESVIERRAQRVLMGSKTKSIPRSAG